MPRVKAPKRPIGKHTDAYKFWHTQFHLDESQYPVTFTGFTKGQAINLAMTLNRINTQEAYTASQVLGIEASSLLPLSAKAKSEVTGLSSAAGGLEGEPWIVEISTNHYHQGRAHASSWLAKHLLQGQLQASGRSPRHEATGPQVTEPPEAPDADAEFLRIITKGSGSTESE